MVFFIFEAIIVLPVEVYAIRDHETKGILVEARLVKDTLELTRRERTYQIDTNESTVERTFYEEVGSDPQSHFLHLPKYGIEYAVPSSRLRKDDAVDNKCAIVKECFLAGICILGVLLLPGLYFAFGIVVVPMPGIHYSQKSSDPNGLTKVLLVSVLQFVIGAVILFYVEGFFCGCSSSTPLPKSLRTWKSVCPYHHRKRHIGSLYQTQ